MSESAFSAAWLSSGECTAKLRLMKQVCSASQTAPSPTEAPSGPRRHVTSTSMSSARTTSSSCASVCSKRQPATASMTSLAAAPACTSSGLSAPALSSALSARSAASVKGPEACGLRTTRSSGATMSSAEKPTRPSSGQAATFSRSRVSASIRGRSMSTRNAWSDAQITLCRSATITWRISCTTRVRMVPRGRRRARAEAPKGWMAAWRRRLPRWNESGGGGPRGPAPPASRSPAAARGLRLQRSLRGLPRHLDAAGGAKNAAALGRPPRLGYGREDVFLRRRIDELFIYY
mmetsp:Transcript_11153/g.33937  ORF Transcript_11153/g.33937 Transcript_11153/m.33937 type:complete len:291 (+) Transcript_11153:645-1517(+)